MIVSRPFGDSKQPGGEPVSRIEPLNASVGLQEGFLENFPCFLAISKHMEGKSQDFPVMPSNQLFKSHAIATLRLFYQELLFVRIVCALFGPSQDCFHDYGR